ITTKQFVLLTDLKSRRCSSISLRLLRSVKPETGVAKNGINTHASQRECQPSCSTGMKKDKGCCYVSFSRWTKELQRTVSAFTCKTCNNVNVVGVLRVKFMARENLVLHGLNHHRVIKSLHHFQSMEHHLPGLPATQVCVVFCVSILADPSDLETKKPPARASLKMTEKARMVQWHKWKITRALNAVFPI
ncbi:hypothetical protein HID58_080361, partial [Brassica napus]